MIPLKLDGVEAFCSYHSEETAKYIHEWAEKNNLIYTCGSDYHGKIKPAIELTDHGCFIDSDDVMKQLDLKYC